MKFTVPLIESMIERNVSPQEEKTITWLSGWEQETQNNLFSILLAYGAATHYKVAKAADYEGSARQARDRALLVIGAFIEDPEKAKAAIAVLDGDLEALRNT
ncbi:hypothetical protein [Paenibacillus sp. 1P03SA]|uniref:hypothetical protein n=1 Tax=Paenibacillus sp. 1P03SA TaxID=3132294 RepID=UPI0039A1EC7E